MTRKKQILNLKLTLLIGLCTDVLTAHSAVSIHQKLLVTLEQKEGGTVEFHAIGRPSALRINGKGAAPQINLTIENNQVSGVASFSLDTLDTGINLRNTHMKKKYLETEKYPDSKITFSMFPLPESLSNENGRADKVPFQGMLLLHGVEKPVSGLAKIERKSGQVQVSADFGLKISDFGITSPGFAGITMAEDVQVSVRFTAPINAKP